MKTGDISLRLRMWAEEIRNKRKERYKLLIDAADRLDELDERAAIIDEMKPVEAEDLIFPPSDNELGDD